MNWWLLPASVLLGVHVIAMLVGLCVKDDTPADRAASLVVLAFNLAALVAMWHGAR